MRPTGPRLLAALGATAVVASMVAPAAAATTAAPPGSSVRLATARPGESVSATACRLSPALRPGLCTAAQRIAVARAAGTPPTALPAPAAGAALGPLAGSRTTLFWTAFLVSDSSFGPAIVAADPAQPLARTTVLSSDSTDFSDTFYSSVAVSPDRTRLAYERDLLTFTDTAGNVVSEIGVLDLRTGLSRTLFRGDDAHLPFAPKWRPDGNALAFSELGFDPAHPLALAARVVSVPTSGTPIATTLVADALMPGWAPDGSRLAVAKLSKAGRFHLVMVQPDGSGAVDIPGGADGLEPAWSHDGTRIAFTRGETVSAASLHVLRLDGRPAPVYSVRAGVNIEPAWSPDDQRIFFSHIGADGGNVFKVLSVGGPTHPAVAALGGGDVNFTPELSGPVAPYPLAVVAGLSTGAVDLSWRNWAGTRSVVVRRSTNAGDPTPQTLTDGTAVPLSTRQHARVSGLQTGGDYGFTIFVTDRFGSTAQLSRRAVPLGAPVLSPTGSAVPALIGAGPAFTVRWGSALPGGATWTGAPYLLQWAKATRIKDGPFSFWIAPDFFRPLAHTTTATTERWVPSAGVTSYYFEVQARDPYDNVTEPTFSRADVPIDDRSPLLAYSPGWRRHTDSGSIGTTFTSTAKAGGSVRVSMPTRGFAVYGQRGPLLGRARIIVDGVDRGVINQFSATPQSRRLLFSISLSKFFIDQHSIQIVNLGTPGHPQTRIDAILAPR